MIVHARDVMEDKVACESCVQGDTVLATGEMITAGSVRFETDARSVATKHQLRPFH